MTFLAIKNIRFSYKKSSVLSDIHLTIAAQSIVALLGPNGCGKSTLLKNIAGLLTPQSGEVFLEGKNIHQLTAKERARQIAFLAQEQKLDFAFSAFEVVLMGRYPYLGALGWESKNDIAIARQAMRDCECEHFAERNIQELSGGERERVFLARCLAQQSPLLLLDEPNTHLDLAHQHQLYTLTQALKNKGKTIVLVLHDLNLAARLADVFVMMKNGSIMAQGSASEVLTPDNIYQSFGVKMIQKQNYAFF